MRTLIFSCLGLMLLGTIAAEMEYDREDLMNFISNLLQSGTGESAGPAVGDENIDTDGDNELAYPMVKRGKMTQEICRRECSSCSKVMNVLFMSCWRDCQLSSTGRSPHNVWSTCRRFLTG